MNPHAPEQQVSQSRDPYVRTRTRVYVLSPSEWGQRACDHLLHRCVAHDGSLTLVVAVRDTQRFRSSRPAIDAWRQYDSVHHAVCSLRDQGAPIEYLFDDRMPMLLERMRREREEGSRVVVYVASQPEYHSSHVAAFRGHADRILVEKPYSILYSDIFGPPDGPVSDATQVLSAEHYMFRPGVTMAITELRSRNLWEFLNANVGVDHFRYEFCFEEAASHDDPNRRLGAYKDGSLLDIAVVHGLGPIARILLPAIGGWTPAGGTSIDLASAIKWTRVAPQYAVDEFGRRKIATLAETGVELHGHLDLSSMGRGVVELSLRSIKGAEHYNRYFRFSRTAKDGQRVGYGVSLGASGYTLIDESGQRHERDGGEFSDRSGGRRRGAANAQAAMLDAFVEPELDRDCGRGGHRFVPIDQTRQILQLALRAQGHASLSGVSNTYRWGGQPKDASELRFHEIGDDAGHQRRLMGAADMSGVDELAGLLGLGEGAETDVDVDKDPPVQRCVSFLGDEGEGGNVLARWLCERASWARPVHVRIPGEVDWSARVESDVNARHLAPNLEFALRKLAAESTAPARGGGPRLLVLSGLEGLSDLGWRQLIVVLDRDYASDRVCMFSTRADRTAGLVLRTRRCMAWMRARPQGAVDDPVELTKAHRLACRSPEEAAALETWVPRVREIVGDNVTAGRLLWAYIELQWRSIVRDRGHGARAAVWLEDHLVAMARPRPLTPDPGGLMDRISRLLLSELPEGRRAELNAIATIDGIELDELRELWPAIAREIEEGQGPCPCAALFEHEPDGRGGRRLARMFPRVRMALTVAQADVVREEARSQRRRLTMCGFHRRWKRLRSQPEHADLGRIIETMYALLAGCDVSSMSFAAGYFDQYVHDLLDALPKVLGDVGHELARACAGRLLSDASDVDLALRRRLHELVSPEIERPSV